jgi:hypothetical protein
MEEYHCDVALSVGYSAVQEIYITICSFYPRQVKVSCFPQQCVLQPAALSAPTCSQQSPVAWLSPPIKPHMTWSSPGATLLPVYLLCQV